MFSVLAMTLQTTAEDDKCPAIISGFHVTQNKSFHCKNTMKLKKKIFNERRIFYPLNEQIM